MTVIRTIDDLMKALPNNIEFDRPLLDNLATLGLAIDECVTITGFKNGQLVSTNTERGHERMINSFLAEHKNF